MIERTEETKVLLEEWSPICDIQAFVEDNGETVYLYLWVHPGREDARIRNCWVCNTVQGSEGLDYDAMNSGRAPRMPLESVAHAPEGIRPGFFRLFPPCQRNGAICL